MSQSEKKASSSSSSSKRKRHSDVHVQGVEARKEREDGPERHFSSSENSAEHVECVARALERSEPAQPRDPLVNVIDREMLFGIFKEFQEAQNSFR